VKLTFSTISKIAITEAMIINLIFPVHERSHIYITNERLTIDEQSPQ